MTKAAELAKLGEVLTNSSKGRTNLIINGDMAVNQRGATSGVTSGYFVDRFRLSGCSTSAVITSSTPTEFPTAITVSATSGNPIVTQRIESKNVQYLSGKVVTASFFAKNVSNATTLYASLQYAGSADNWGSSTTITEHNLGSLSSDWVKYTASWTVPSGGLNGLALNILCAGSSTFTMGVTGVMLQEGSVSTPFEHLSHTESLILCQRYCFDVNPATGASPNTPYIMSVAIYNDTLAISHVQFPTEMRTTPTTTLTGAAADFSIVEGNQTRACTGFAANGLGAAGGGMYWTVNAGGMTTGNAGYVYIESNKRAFFDAEI